jgi:hypothetical protein
MRSEPQVERKRLAVLLFAGAAAAGTAYYLYHYSAQRERKGGRHSGDGGPGTAVKPLIDQAQLGSSTGDAKRRSS